MTAQIHSAAFVDKSAELGSDVSIGAGAVVEGDVVIGDNTTIGAHTHIFSGTRIGRRNRIFGHCSLGGEPQDKKFKGEETQLVIGDDNVVREFCFFNRGTAASGETRIGDRNWIMAYVHFGHDCIAGSDSVIANLAQFAGHVTLGDFVTIGGGALVHQFCRIGAHAMLAGGSALAQDLPPYALYHDRRNLLAVNLEGMRRRSFSKEEVDAVRAAYRVLHRERNIEKAREIIAAQDGVETKAMRPLLEFLATRGRGLPRAES